MSLRLLLYTFFITVTLLPLSSCKLREKMVYLQEKEVTDSTSRANPVYNPAAYAPTLRPDDLLQIQVGGQDAEALAAFQFYVNVSGSGANQNAAQAGLQASQASASINYLIDPNGNINFPVLGFVQVAGLTRLEATVKLQELLGAYVTDPVVNIQIKNFKVSILGEVARPGAYTLPSDRVSILEAVAMAGDLKLSGIRQNVLLVREQDGKRIEYRLDLTQKDIYQSPAYYLRQNDVIYVEPNKGARFQGQNITVFTQVISTSLSLLLSMYTLITIF
ncbi:MAG: polysaccharide biosynthesis/export family protein [Crocinitomicaceae bacterium]|nr:polysaccharide biosynthesis/export family protein [Crocinitomicaceae bacterium]